MIIYQGPSLYDGREIAVVAACLDGRSSNMKTGPMVQLYVVPYDRNPIEAIRHGDDHSTCGNCPIKSGCYTHSGNSINGMNAVWSALQRGLYGRKPASKAEQKRAFRNRYVRFGAYGNCSAAPFEAYQTILAVAAGITCYIHDWQTADPRWSAVSMASVETVADMEIANSMGYATFRVVRDAKTDRVSSEKICAYEKSGNVLPCIACMKCDGQHGNIIVSAHGSGKKRFNWE